MSDELGDRSELPTIVEGPTSARVASKSLDSSDQPTIDEPISIRSLHATEPPSRISLPPRLLQTSPTSGSLSNASVRFTQPSAQRERARGLVEELPWSKVVGDEPKGL